MKKKSLLSVVVFFIASALSWGAMAQQEDNQIYDGVDTPAMYSLGKEKLVETIINTTIYPQEAISSGIEGTVRVLFVVEKNGTMSNFEILDSLSPVLDAAAINIIKALPANWTPATIEGQAVRYRMYIPIDFKLPNN
jgi:protein TonB